MAKGVEDTAFYRWHRLIALNEVGGDPGQLGRAAGGVPRLRRRSLQADWPATMTTLSTHDTKRSEDVRARLLALTELPAGVGGRRPGVDRGGGQAPLPRGLAGPRDRRT